MNTPPASVVLYTLGGCGHCTTARRLLQRLDIPFEEHHLDGVTDFRGLLVERTGGWTVPQVVIGGEPIGGASDLARLQRRSVLLARVNGDAFPVAVVHRRLAPGRMLAALLTRPSGARRAAWRDSVELRDRDGRVVQRRAPPPVDDARTGGTRVVGREIRRRRCRLRRVMSVRARTQMRAWLFAG
jgi:glutaredoxin 3